MPILSISRWQIQQDQAAQVVREAAPLLKKQGASRVTLGHVRTGEHTGQTLIAVQYENWETFGSAMQAQHDDQQYHQAFRQAMQNGAQLKGRTILATEEIQ
jgi:hypothetical protein